MAMTAQMIFCVLLSKKEGVVKSIIMAIAQTGVESKRYGRILPQRVRVRSIINPESESSSASYSVSMKIMVP